jgi:hypothetical protein
MVGKWQLVRLLTGALNRPELRFLRSISALDNDSGGVGLLGGMAGCGDHGTERSVSLCLASATFFVGLVILLSSLIGMMCSP